MSVIIVFVFMLVVVSASIAQMSANILRGTVRMTANGVPYTAVRIQLQKFGMPIQVTFLRESRFEFWNIETGRYTLIIEAPGYDTVRQDIEVPGEWPIIQLHPQRNTAQPAET